MGTEAEASYVAGFPVPLPLLVFISVKKWIMYTWSHWTYLSSQIDVQKRPEEPSRSRSEFEEVRGGSVATYDYPYFNLRLTWGEVEAEGV